VKHLSISCLVVALSLAVVAGASAELREDPAAKTGQTVAEPLGGPVTLILDDGSSDNTIGDAGQFIWLNRFTPAPTDFPFALEEISAVFGTTAVPLGGAIELVVFSDTDADGDPGTGAVFVDSFNVTVQANDGVTFSVYPIAPAPVLFGPGDVIIGVINRYGSEGLNDFPAGLDQTASQVRSWAASYLAGDVPNPPFLPADEQWGTIDSFGFPGNWIVRGAGQGVVPVVLQNVSVDE
jgi:hypothetical protein